MDNEFAMRPGPFVVSSPSPEDFCRFWCHLFDWQSQEMGPDVYLLKSGTTKILVKKGKQQNMGKHILHLEMAENLGPDEQEFFIQKYKFALYRSGLKEQALPFWSEETPAGLVFKDPDKRTWKILNSDIL